MIEVTVMDNLKNDFKGAMNQIMQNEDSVFTEREKHKVLSAIKQKTTYTKTANRFLIPRALTSLLTISFIVLLGGLAANYFGIMDFNNHASLGEEQQEPNSKKENQDKIVQPEDDILSSAPFALKLDNRMKIILSPELKNAYNEFSATKDERILAELAPAEIFQLFYYAEEHHEANVQYALYIQDEDYINPFGTLEEYQKAKLDPISESNTEKFLLKLKSASLQEIIFDDKNAVIQIGDETGFKIIKNNNGIWKVSWLPLQ